MRLIFPLVLGLVGGAILVSLGLWQLDRAGQKDATLAAISARIAEAPVALPAALDPEADLYRAVAADGVVAGRAVAIFDTWRAFGPGVRAIVPFETGGRTILLDLGVAPWVAGTDPADAAADAPPPGTLLAVTGNLDWPAQEAGEAPVRDTAALAAGLGTDAVMLIAREVVPETAFRPIPVSTEGIPDNHMGYAIQWFGLALVWVGMTLYWVWRIRRRTV